MAKTRELPSIGTIGTCICGKCQEEFTFQDLM